MEPEEKEKIKLGAREILLTFCDGLAKFQEIVGYPWQRKEIQKYWKWRELDKASFAKTLWRLEKRGYLKRYQGSKGKLLELKLTHKGKKKAFNYLANKLKIKKPTKWDQKWRLVIFDIPKDKKELRDIVRATLKRWGFFQLQKSVFVYPFDCREAVAGLKYFHGCSRYLQYIIAEEIESEVDLVSYFYDQGILEDLPFANRNKPLNKQIAKRRL